MIVYRCPSCRGSFKMRDHGNCPHCAVPLYMGDDIRHNLHYDAPKGFWMDPKRKRWRPVAEATARRA